ncbi:MAG: fold metallo-hydrolase [Anaerocolumna sp.]|nr:fold metallo-hydrolase [Anaerocolumna sp.]
MSIIASKQKVNVRFLGRSSTEVTGSIILVECPTGEKILLDCGLYQNANLLESYKVNTSKFDFKPSEITFAAISHLNIDHLGLIPKLFADGADFPVYMYYHNIEFVPIMLEDSAKIMERDSVTLTRRYKKEYLPIYSQSNVDKAVSHLLGCAKNEIIQVTPNVGLKFVPAGHIFGSTQIMLYIKSPSGHIDVVSYSGDIGNIIFEQPFVEDFEPIIKSNIFIGECTYNDPLRSAKKENRSKDLEIIESVIRQTIENKGSVLIPCFALQRMETMLYTLWSVFHNDESFTTQIIVDSPLAVKLLDAFEENLEDGDAKLFEMILGWKNIKIIRTIEESQSCVEDTRPKIICSSSGMLTQGRSILYLKKILPNPKSAIITCGYMAEGSLGWKIKNMSNQKTITIDNKPYANRCSIHSLKSFSSHMQFEQLINYYTNLSNNGCQTICLVHSDNGKLNFKKALEDNIRKIGKTTKVVAVNKDTVTRI